MTTTLWLRISSVIALLFAAGHALGGRSDWSPMADNPVIDSMRTVPFQVMGVTRTYLDFYLGFGYSIAVTQVMMAVILWQLAGLARTDARRIRPIIAVITLASVLGAAIAWHFILPLPAFFSLVLTATLAIAYAVAR